MVDIAVTGIQREFYMKEFQLSKGNSFILSDWGRSIDEVTKWENTEISVFV